MLTRIIFRSPVFTGLALRYEDQYRENYQIPNEFGKVVVMVRTEMESRTAYVQSQKDYNRKTTKEKPKKPFSTTALKTYQDLKSVEQMTGLDFGELRKYDRFAYEATEERISELENTGL